jgi:hypothetical protein
MCATIIFNLGIQKVIGRSSIQGFRGQA